MAFVVLAETAEALPTPKPVAVIVAVPTTCIPRPIPPSPPVHVLHPGWKSYTTHDGLADSFVSSIAVAPDGTPWFGIAGGITRFDGETWTTYTTDDGLVDNAIYSVAVAPDGALWFGKDTVGLSMQTNLDISVPR